MKARVLIDFYDSKEKELRLAGDIFELFPARFDEILKRGGELIEEVDEKLTAPIINEDIDRVVVHEEIGGEDKEKRKQ